MQSVVTSRPPAQFFLSRARRSAVLCLLLAMVTLAFYNPIVHNQFTNLDDDSYILDNSHVRAGLTWDPLESTCRHASLSIL